MPEIACTLLRILDGRRIQWYREVLAELARAIADGTRRATTASH
jgi:(2Fe-2S) ferredoxin